VLLSFRERYGKLIAGHPEAKKEMDLVRASVVQISKLVQNTTKVTGTGAKWKQLTYRAEADRHTLCKFLDGEALFSCLVHMYTTTHKETRTAFNRAAWNPDRKVFRKQNTTNAARETKTLERRAEARNGRGHLKLTITQSTNNFLAPIRDLLMESEETGSEGNSTKTPGTNDS
jgi:hypothetical protein